MKTVRNILIGTVIATLMFSMLATPAAATVTADPYVDDTWTSGDHVRDETGVTLCGDGQLEPNPDDLLQVIWDKNGDGLSPPDPDDPSKCTNSDDVIHDLMYIGHQYGEGTGCFYDTIFAYIDIGAKVYMRAWNAPTIEEATYYGDSPVNYTMLDGTHAYDYCPPGHTWSTDTPKPAPTVPTESRLVEMKLDWNLISLCFEPEDNSTSAVLSTIWDNVTTGSVKKWDASLDTWAEATTMDRGTGYFVHITQDCMWNHTGTNVTDALDIPLKTGLNLVGYPFNKTNTTSDALSGLNYYYAAPFNATGQKYDRTFNPAAPEPFNEFTEIEPCEGFWISAKNVQTWTASP